VSDVLDAPSRAARLNYVNGAWVPSASGATYARVNPMRPDENVGEFSASTEEDAHAAVAAASTAFAIWSSLPAARRAAYLNAAAGAVEARAEEIARDMSTEMGKPLREARGETARASQILRFAAGEAFRAVGEHFEQSLTGAQVSTRRRPVGVVGLIMTGFCVLAVSALGRAGGVPMAYPPSYIMFAVVTLMLVALGSGMLSLGILKKSQPADLLR
jgi:delta 1-pyrroline-5-carboxylate dehydrogenase